jgi:hypothetical protein
MNLKQLAIALLIFFSSQATLYAAGEPVIEDLTLLYELSQDMIALCNKKDADSFMEMVAPALKLTAENRNNSIALPRISARLREAKKAVKSGKFDDAIEALKQAQIVMQKKRVLAWDGGSE